MRHVRITPGFSDGKMHFFPQLYRLKSNFVSIPDRFNLFQAVSDSMLVELKACFMEAYDDNQDGKIDIREVSIHKHNIIKSGWHWTVWFNGLWVVVGLVTTLPVNRKKIEFWQADVTHFGREMKIFFARWPFLRWENKNNWTRTLLPLQTRWSFFWCAGHFETDKTKDLATQHDHYWDGEEPFNSKHWCRYRYITLRHWALLRREKTLNSQHCNRNCYRHVITSLGE